MAGLLKDLLEIERVLDRINLKLEKAMATAQDFKILLDGIDAETDRLAVKVQELIDLVTASALTGAEETEIHDRLVALRDRLAVIGDNPNEPIPPAP